MIIITSPAFQLEEVVINNVKYFLEINTAIFHSHLSKNVHIQKPRFMTLPLLLWRISPRFIAVNTVPAPRTI